jgi:hypothetical protein
MDKIVRRKKRQEIALKCSLIFCHGLCEKKNTPKYSLCKNNQKAQSANNFKPLQLLYIEQI